MLRLARAYRSALALACALSLLVAVPVLAEPIPGSPSDTGTVLPTDPDPLHPGGDETTGTPEPSQDSTDSAVDVEVDEKTERFREELAAQQAVIDEFKAQLDELDRQLAISVESYNASVEELERTREVLDTTSEDLAKARAAYDEQTSQLSDRVLRMYLQGDMSGVELLLDSNSLRDFFNRLVFLTTVSKRDGAAAGELATQREQIEEDVLEIESARLQAEALEFALEAQQIEIMLRIEERQQMLASAQVDLLELLDEEAARRALEQQELLSAIMSGASDVGIQVIEGTPVETAFAYHGIPYLWGGETPAGFDCSGLVLYVFEQHGVELPHYSGSQFLLGARVAPQDLRPGDVVFFGSPIHHVGIYVGAGYYIHAPRTGDFVKVSSLVERTDYAGARRYAWTMREGPPVGVDIVGPVVPAGTE